MGVNPCDIKKEALQQEIAANEFLGYSKKEPPSSGGYMLFQNCKLACSKKHACRVSGNPSLVESRYHFLANRDLMNDPKSEMNYGKVEFQNPLFATYATAASLMILKASCMSWLTVVRMMSEKGGYRSPEDLQKTLINPSPNPKQLEPNEKVDRVRRIHLNDLENLPFFLVAGFLYILAQPSL